MENNEARDEMPYGREPKTELQRFMRLKKEGEFNNHLYKCIGSSANIYLFTCVFPFKRSES